MEKAKLIKIRKELHNLEGKERGFLPLRVWGPTTNFCWDESTECFMWDDENEVLYILMSNQVPAKTTDNQAFPMQILTIAYEDITFISVAVDRNALDNFMKDAVERNMTQESTRQRYFNDMTALYDPHTYMMGKESPTTEKRPVRPDDEIVNPDVKFL